MVKLSRKVIEIHPKSCTGVLLVREYNEKRDKEGVEEVEKQCDQYGSTEGTPSLITDLLGDPISRIRQSASYVMLVAEYDDEIVGMIMGSVKSVTRGKNSPTNGVPSYVKTAYILGLRVLPSHRRLGLGTKLVEKLEEWCIDREVQYAYMATECSNKASINLFTQKCAYAKFRTPTILVHPVHAHKKPLSSGTAIVQLPPELSESIYCQLFANSEFFPKDIGTIISNKLSLGTYMAMPKKFLHKWDPEKGSNFILPPSFAILSIWNTKEVFKFQLKGVSKMTHAGCVASRVMDTWMPWLKIPSIPNLFSPFGFYLLYGLHMEGTGGPRHMNNLCSFVHNIAKDDVGCGAVVAEVGMWDPVKDGIPYWRKFSWEEDIWCMKRLGTSKDEVDGDDWSVSPPSSSVIFVDPRDF